MGLYNRGLMVRYMCFLERKRQLNTIKKEKEPMATYIGIPRCATLIWLIKMSVAHGGSYAAICINSYQITLLVVMRGTHVS